MGVPYYFYVITQTYEGILLQHLPAFLKCHHFILDFNGLIHPSSQKYIKSLTKPPKDLEKGIMAAIWSDTQDLIKLVQPLKTVQIYIDGVAPIAKMHQQRKRRFMSVYRKKVLCETNDAWDSNAISPATTFMCRLHASIKAYIRYSKAEFAYHFSSSDEPGEGEHKLFEKIANKYNSPDEVKVIYGMDADLIMLALFSHIPKIFLLRENQHATNEEDKYLYLDIDKLRSGIIADLRRTYNWNVSNDALDDTFNPSAKHVIESYATVCFLMGNDFLPHPVCLNLKKNGLQYVLTHAGKIWNVTDSYHNKSGLNWAFISQLLEVLCQHESENMYNAVSEHSKKKAHFSTPAEELEAYPLINKDPFESEFLQKKHWKPYYYKHLFNSTINDTVVINVSCELYLKGLMWTYLYYKRLPKDNQWYYPYGYAPTMHDLSNYLNSQISVFEKLEDHWKTTYPRDIFCEPIVQLLSILPKESVECLPPKYRQLMINNEKLAYMYPISYSIQTFMKTKLWECNQLLPPMNIEFVKKIVATIK